MPSLLGFEFNKKDKYKIREREKDKSDDLEYYPSDSLEIEEYSLQENYISEQESEKQQNADILQKTNKDVQTREKVFVTEEITGVIVQIPVKNIMANPNQPRANFDEKALFSLAQSIQNYGMIQPLTVRKIQSQSIRTDEDNDNGDDIYELVAGERRLRAASILCMETVPCVVIDVSTQASAELALIENLQREDLNFFEQGMAIFKLIDMYNYTQEQIARKLSVSQSYIANKLRILKLSPEEQEVIIRENLTERHARSLIRIHDINERKSTLLTIIKRNMNVSSTDKYIDKILLSTKTAKQKNVMILKDIRLFLNSIDKAVDLVSQSGINIKSEKVDKGEFIEVHLSIPKTNNKKG